MASQTGSSRWFGVAAVVAACLLPVSMTSASDRNACGCYQTDSGSCICDKQAKCGCPGSCEPQGCEERRDKALQKEIELETRKARDADKQRAAASDSRRARERRPGAGAIAPRARPASGAGQAAREAARSLPGGASERARRDRRRLARPDPALAVAALRPLIDATETEEHVEVVQARQDEADRCRRRVERVEVDAVGARRPVSGLCVAQRIAAWPRVGVEIVAVAADLIAHARAADRAGRRRWDVWPTRITNADNDWPTLVLSVAVIGRASRHRLPDP